MELNDRVAQWIAHLTSNQGVVGSSPIAVDLLQSGLTKWLRGSGHYRGWWFDAVGGHFAVLGHGHYFVFCVGASARWRSTAFRNAKSDSCGAG